MPGRTISPPSRDCDDDQVIDNSLALLLLHVETVTGAALLAITLATLMLMDFVLDGDNSELETDR